MTTAAELRALADEVERLEGPSREMDQRIALASGWLRLTPSECRNRGGGWVDGNERYTQNDGRTIRNAPPPYTASLDAAAGLMPEGWLVEVYDRRGDVEPSWLVIGIKDRINDETWKVGKAATEALARSACALRARAALMDGGRDG